MTALETILSHLLRKPYISQSKFHIVNEAVNFEKQCIFIAVPKSGTNSIRSQLKQPGIPLIGHPHLNIVQIRDALYIYFLRQALGRNANFPTGQVPTDEHIRSQAAHVFDNCFKFAAVRNPWARAVSLYFRRDGVQTRDKISFEEFCEQHIYASDTCHHPTLHQNQLDWLCDTDGTCIMDYVYKLEDFEVAIKEIAERTQGRVRLAKRMANRNPGSSSRSYREIYTQHTKALIAKRFQKDIDYFKYAF